MTIIEELLETCSDNELKLFTSLDQKGNIAVNSIAIFDYFENKLSDSQRVLELLDAFSEIAKSSSKLNFGLLPETGALNNCKGRWFELIFFKKFLNELSKNNDASPKEIFKLPSSDDEHAFINIFEEDVRNELSKIGLWLSNPDFIILNGGGLASRSKGNSTLEKFNFRGYFGRVKVADLIAVISIKTSARPDRRYQPLYEANAVKALLGRYNHPIKFIVIDLHESRKNELVYHSTSIISATLDKEEFKPSIDKSMILETLEDVELVIEYINH